MRKVDLTTTSWMQRRALSTPWTAKLAWRELFVPGRPRYTLEKAQIWLRCRIRGHHWVVQQFEYHTHLMTLQCDRCRITQTTTVPKVKLSSNEITQPKASNH